MGGRCTDVLYLVVYVVVCTQTMCGAPYAGLQPHSGPMSRTADVTARTAQQLVPDRCTPVAEAGTRGKVKSVDSQYVEQRAGPYPTPQQYMLNKRAKYAGTAATLAADVRTTHTQTHRQTDRQTRIVTLLLYAYLLTHTERQVLVLTTALMTRPVLQS